MLKWVYLWFVSLIAITYTGTVLAHQKYSKLIQNDTQFYLSLQYQDSQLSDSEEAIDKLWQIRAQKDLLYNSILPADTSDIDKKEKEILLALLEGKEPSQKLEELQTLVTKKKADLLAEAKNRSQSISDKIDDLHEFAQFYGIDLSDMIQKRDQTLKPNSSDEETIKGFIELAEVFEEYENKVAAQIEDRGGEKSPNGKRIVIYLSGLRLYMIEDYKIVHSFPITAGQKGKGTARGEFKVYDKDPYAWGIHDIWMPWWLTIYYVGSAKNGIHGIPVSPSNGRWTGWESYIGNSNITYGCITTYDNEAKNIYQWADVGTPVSIL